MSCEITAIIQREGDRYVALCPEFDVARQGAAVQQARAKLAEAVELFLGSACSEEIARRTHSETWVTRVEVGVDQMAGRRWPRSVRKTPSTGAIRP